MCFVGFPSFTGALWPMGPAAPRCVLECRSEQWMNRPSVCENVPSDFPLFLSLSLFPAAHTHIQPYIYTQSYSPCQVFALLSIPAHNQPENAWGKTCALSAAAANISIQTRDKKDLTHSVLCKKYSHSLNLFTFGHIPSKNIFVYHQDFMW